MSKKSQHLTGRIIEVFRLERGLKLCLEQNTGKEVTLYLEKKDLCLERGKTLECDYFPSTNRIDIRKGYPIN